MSSKKVKEVIYLNFLSNEISYIVIKKIHITMKYKFNNIGLSGYLDDEKVVDLLSIIEKDLKSNGLEIFLLGNYEVPKELNSINTLKKDKFLESVDLIVAIGGDGTLLSAARDAAKKNIPFSENSYQTLLANFVFY